MEAWREIRLAIREDGRICGRSVCESCVFRQLITFASRAVLRPRGSIGEQRNCFAFLVKRPDLATGIAMFAGRKGGCLHS